MKRRCLSRIGILFAALGLSALLAGCGRPSEPKVGIYRATLTLPGGDLPFQIEVAKEANATVMYLVNGEERTRVSDISLSEGQLAAKFPGIENRLIAKISRSSLDGEVVMIRKDGEEQKLPFQAKLGQTYRFFEKVLSDNADVAGRWEVTFTSDDNKSYPAVGEFSQTHDQVTGTFLTSTGDHHFLAGQMRGDELFLSMFDGAHAFLYKGKIDAEGTLHGEYWSGSHSHERFVAKRNADAALPAEPAKAQQETLSFTFPDLSGNNVSLSDEKFRNKVVLVTLGGSWCGNCHDEAAFLVPFYKEYRERGFEVVGLMFERFGDFPRAVEAASRFRKHFGIDYTMLIAGISDTDEASNRLPQLSHVYAFPTAVLLDRKGKIRKIHTGFSGPATGVHYETYKKEFTAAVEELLGEK
jgi:thiol-disulfide isomerase/thioredoxin